MTWARFLVLLAAMAAGAAINGWRLTAAHEQERAARAEETGRQLVRVSAERDEKAEQLSEANDRHLRELQGAKNETNRIRDCMRAGTCGLRIRATVPTCVPEAAPGAWLDPGAGSRPDPDLERAYLAHRDAIDQAGAQLKACQTELRLRSK